MKRFWRITRWLGAIVFLIAFCLTGCLDVDTIWHLILGFGVLIVVGIFGFVLYNIAEKELIYYDNLHFNYGNNVLPGDRIYL